MVMKSRMQKKIDFLLKKAKKIVSKKIVFRQKAKENPKKKLVPEPKTQFFSARSAREKVLFFNFFCALRAQKHYFLGFFRAEKCMFQFFSRALRAQKRVFSTSPHAGKMQKYSFPACSVRKNALFQRISAPEMCHYPVSFARFGRINVCFGVFLRGKSQIIDFSGALRA